MCRYVLGLMLVLSMVPLVAEGTDPENFRVRSTADLVAICSTPSNDSMYPAAISFCHGFAVGAYQYYYSVHAGPGTRPFVCLPDPPPSRTEALQMFVKWARENPQYMGEPAVETLFRWLATQWPCAR